MGHFGGATVVAVTAGPCSYGGSIAAGVAGVATAGARSGVVESTGGSSGPLAAGVDVLSLPTTPSVEIFDRVKFRRRLC